MRLRDGNIIVCGCGAELNPEIVTDHDFIVYAGGVATCSNCRASEAISLETPEVIAYKTDIELLNEKNGGLENLIAQTNADFSGFMDYYFSINPE
jgi:hypothetical protein